MNEDEAAALRQENRELKNEIARLEALIKFGIPLATHDSRTPTGILETAGPVSHRPLPLAGDIEDVQALYGAIKEMLLADTDARLLSVFMRVPEIEVTKQVERIRVDYASQPGVIAALLAEGFFNQRIKPAAVIAELKRRGRAVHPANVSRDLGRLTEQGFLTREGDGYQQVAGMRVNIVEAA